MILVDTNIWIDFFQSRKKATSLPILLQERSIICHPWIIGELSVGHLGTARKDLLWSLRLLPQLPIHEIDNVCTFIEAEKLYGLGLSLVDIQLLLSSIQGKCLFWTGDKALTKIAKKYGLSYSD